MDSLLAEIQEDITWRVSEISNIKTIPHRYRLLETHKNTLISYSIPSLYAIWEGFIRNTFQLLTTYINNLEMEPRIVNINILTHAIENECQLGNERKQFKKKVGLVESTLNIIDSSFYLKQGIPTESNVNYKITNKILERFNIKDLDIKYEKPLDRLLLFRNKISHGENSIKVTKQDVVDFTLLIENLMFEILIMIEDYLKNKKYEK